MGGGGHDGLITLFLCGDVMTGRGIDQILPHPGDPRLREGYVRDARTYVKLAEAVNGPIPYPVDHAWPWGDALEVLDGLAPDVRVINLETTITGCDDAAVGKAVHYRMNPANVPCLAVARPDACVLANNHVLDFGPAGLAETCDTLTAAGIRTVGAGRDAAAAARPVIVPVGGRGRVIVYAFAAGSSGVPRAWAATPHGPGVNRLPDLSEDTARVVATAATDGKRLGDVVVASIHWGSNWGYEVPAEQVRFAHRLVEGGVDLVHGHSSHHPRAVEIYRDRLVLYGCGDLIDDYEGIGGHGRYRNDLRLLYLVSVEPGTGRLAGLRTVPMRAHRMRLHHASRTDAEQMRGVLDRISGRFVARAELTPDGMITTSAE